MNSFLVKTNTLASGQNLPFTGEWANTALCKNGLLVTYISGSNINIFLQGKSLMNDLPGGASYAYTFYSQTGLNNGYSDPIFFDSPITEIRLVASGVGKIWSYITYQN